MSAAVAPCPTSAFWYTISGELGVGICVILGVHEKTIMKIGGWKTRSVFDRYNIVDEKDLADAAAKLDQKALERKPRHSSGTMTSKSSTNNEVVP
jgi:hypothetical protein